jgi:hypothetical protein
MKGEKSARQAAIGLAAIGDTEGCTGPVLAGVGVGFLLREADTNLSRIRAASGILGAAFVSAASCTSAIPEQQDGQQQARVSAKKEPSA